jgi:hypothetical protein
MSRGASNAANACRRVAHVLELALYHSLGKLPEPESTHDFL